MGNNSFKTILSALSLGIVFSLTACTLHVSDPSVEGFENIFVGHTWHERNEDLDGYTPKELQNALWPSIMVIDGKVYNSVLTPKEFGEISESKQYIHWKVSGDSLILNYVGMNLSEGDDYGEPIYGKEELQIVDFSECKILLENGDSDEREWINPSCYDLDRGDVYW